MKIHINDKEHDLPESWNDLELNQQIGCYAILMSDSREMMETQEMLPYKRVGLVKYLLGLSDEFMTQWEKDCIAVNGEKDGTLVFLSELSEILKCTDFLLDKLEDGEYQIKLGLTKCPWPKLEHINKEKGRLKKKAFYAPADGLDNLSIYELGTTFTLFEDFIKDKNIDKAEELIATIYRPSKPPTKYNKQSAYQGDRRQPLLDHEGMVKKRIKKIHLLTSPVKQLILFWFASCRQQIIDNYPNIFESPKGEKSGNDYGWGGVLMALAEGIKDLDKVAKQPYINALTYLSWREDQRIEAEMEAKRNRRRSA